ncbi:IclR family transcriptional regulator domain-containing protein [Saccharopolyspora shandongensis]|uniref:IclR family transcriptional regulator domain-containing protein n=1 Tax=Saccharopolyspora shandongensis TaxID=418495 RepID=UPI0033F71244
MQFAHDAPAPEVVVDEQDQAAPYFVTAVERGMAVLQAFTAARPELNFTEAGDLTGLSRATTRRLMLTLRDLGFLTSEDARTFRLAPKVLQLGYSYLSSMPLRDIARPHLETLSGELGETAGLAVLDGTEILYVAIAMCPRLTAVRINLGTRFPAPATAAGRVLLAHLPTAALDKALAETTLDRAAGTTSERVFRDRLAEIHDQGWALADSELDDELRGAAAPVADQDGRVTAAVSVSLHSGRQTVAAMQRDVIPQVTHTAGLIHADLTGTPRARF